MLTFQINGQTCTYPEGTTYGEIARDYQPAIQEDIILVSANYVLHELDKVPKEEESLRFITAADPAGMFSYKRSVAFLFLKAFYDTVGYENVEKVTVDFSISKGYFCEPKGDFLLTQALLDRVEGTMRRLVKKDIPLRKKTVPTAEAIRLFRKHRMYDKERLFYYRRVSSVNIYSIENFDDYFYGYMVPSTGYLKYFKLFLYNGGVVVQMPERNNPRLVPPFVPQEKLFNTQMSSSEFARYLGVPNVGRLNEMIVSGDVNELILVQEAWQEEQLSRMANEISRKKNVKFVMIAGPSSSGKTTFSHRLAIQLKAHGLRPHPIAVDDYFVNREDNPRDEFGNYNYEDLESIDCILFNEQMNRLLQGETVELPTYNFKTGFREFKGNFKKLGEEDILIIEGIHCLNERLYDNLPRENMYKIYISALTQLNIDEHNRIPTTDTRLIRRLVRDARTRGTDARTTIAMWNNVRKGEDRNIFPFQESCDFMFNSAMVYELAVLKAYAEPCLFSVPRDCPEYQEAKRLLKFLDYFLSIPTENVPKNSLLREFVGGSIFKV